MKQQFEAEQRFKMMKSMHAVLLLAWYLPSVLGSAELVPRLSTAACSGHFKDLIVTSATCDYSEDGCTYGSQVFVTGQGRKSNILRLFVQVHYGNTRTPAELVY